MSDKVKRTVTRLNAGDRTQLKNESKEVLTQQMRSPYSGGACGNYYKRRFPCSKLSCGQHRAIGDPGPSTVTPRTVPATPPSFPKAQP